MCSVAKKIQNRFKILPNVTFKFTKITLEFSKLAKFRHFRSHWLPSYNLTLVWRTFNLHTYNLFTILLRYLKATERGTNLSGNANKLLSPHSQQRTPDGPAVVRVGQLVRHLAHFWLTWSYANQILLQNFSLRFFILDRADVQLCYDELMHSHWLKIVMWHGTSILSALFHPRKAKPL